MSIFSYCLLITLTNILTPEEIYLRYTKEKKELAKYFMVRSFFDIKNSKMNLKENGMKIFALNDFLKRATLLNLSR